ncbi:MAG: TetR/AcrR family transcriptional regulator [Phycisphaerae bacterium]|jgi:AcrR family transcriptional regulator|nr:TetR/AcrR family transcriptional regulator [Phycisphaerae bacterium]MDP7286595.1 TetR/AcrR family transcriptional regulator [Phycisphaerae bacterium]
MARPAKKKALIVKAAVGLFATKGVPRTTTRDIAQAASVAEGTLYRHWSSKDEMAWDLYCLMLEEFITDLKPAIFDEKVPFGDRLDGMIESIYEFYRTHSDEFTFILLIPRSFPQQRYPNENPYVLLSEVLEAEIAAGTIPHCDTATLSAMVLGAILQPVMHHRWGFSQTQPICSSRAVARACMEMILAFARDDGKDTQ